MRYFSLALVAWILAGCAAETADHSDDLLVVADEMRATFEAAAGAPDPSPLFSLLHAEGQLIPPGGPIWDRILADAAAQGRPYPVGFSIKITPQELVVMSDDWAYEFGTSKVTYTPEGEDEMVVRDTYLILFRHDGEGWKLYREVASLRPQIGGFPEDG